jgi:hypothetical protein
MRTGTVLTLLILTACAGPSQTSTPEPQPPPQPAAQPVAAAPPGVTSMPAEAAGDPAYCGTPNPSRTGPPPAKATNTCPHPFVFTASRQPQYMWLSTEGTFKFEERSHSPRFFMHLNISKDQPVLVVETAAYKYTTPIAPDRSRTFRVNNWQILLEQVVPGPDTRFEANTWHSSGQVRVHAALRVDPVLPPFDRPIAATTPCGDPSLQRTGLPDGLAQHPVPGATLTFNHGQSKKIGDVEVEYVTRNRQRSGLPPEPRTMLGLRDPTAPYPNVVELHADHSGGFIRADRELLLAAQGTAKKPMTVRRFALACPSAITVPAPSAPTWLWLGTFGRTRAVVGDPAAPALTLEIKYGQLWATSQNGAYSRFLSPEIEQNAFSLDGYIVEVIDVAPTGDDRYVEGHWRSDTMIAGVNVQLRVTPNP